MNSCVNLIHTLNISEQMKKDNIKLMLMNGSKRQRFRCLDIMDIYILLYHVSHQHLLFILLINFKHIGAFCRNT